MTPLVADKTPISAKYWRRKSDPPSFWITVFVTSISLHGLGFLLIRSSDNFGLWFPSSNQNTVAIELIDIPAVEKPVSTSNSTAKTVTPEPVIVTAKPPEPTTKNPIDIPVVEKPVTTSNSTTKTVTPQPVKAKTPETPHKNQNDLVRKNSVKNQPYISPANNNPVTAQKLDPKLDPTPTATSNPIPTVPVNDLPWNRRQEVRLGRGTLLPQDIPVTPPTPTGESSPNPTATTPPTPTGESSPNPTTPTPPTPTGESSPNPTTPTPNKLLGGAIATISSISKNELSQLIQEKQWRTDALPDVLAQYKGSYSKQLDLISVPGNGGIKPAKILASLVIDQNGKFQQAVVLEIEPPALISEKSIYEQALNELFQSDKFIPAYNQDGSQPPLSNLFLRISIKTDP